MSTRGEFAVLTQHPPAGGCVRIRFTIEALDAPEPLLVGMDRSTGRPAHVTITGQLDGTPLADPADGPADMGGPSGSIQVQPGTPYTQVLLVNQFVRLEEAHEAVAPGETRLLSLDCARTAPPVVSAKLEIPLVRDDAALAAEIADLVAVVREHDRPGTSNELEDALAALVAVRLPIATAALAELSDHPNPLVRDVASRAASRTP